MIWFNSVVLYIALVLKTVNRPGKFARNTYVFHDIVVSFRFISFHFVSFIWFNFIVTA